MFSSRKRTASAAVETYPAVAARTYAAASSTVSVKSREPMRWLFGAHITPPPAAVVPPSWSAFSRTRTEAPASRATRAAVIPAQPEPMTTRS